MKSLSSKTYQCGVTIQGLTTLSGTVYLTGITNTASWDHVIVGTTAQGQIYTRTYAQFMGDVATGISLSSYVSGSGTTNYLPKFTGASTIGNSGITDDGSGIGITGSAYATLTLNSTNANGWGTNINFQQSGTGFGYVGAYGSLVGSTTKDMTIWANSGNGFRVNVNNSNTSALILNTSGNLGLGVTPSAWGSGLKALEINAVGNSLVGLGNGDIILMSNAYYNSGFLYAGTNYATSYRQQDGVHKWSTAPSGTAGNAISFTQAMTLNASGLLMIGGNANDGRRLTILGTTNDLSGIGITYLGVAASSVSVNSSGSMLFGLDSADGKTTRLTIASTGAATFSSSVTATQLYLGSLTNEQLMISGTGSRGIGVSTTTSGDPYVRLYDNTTIKADIWWGRSGAYMGINSLGSGSITAINPNGGNVGIGTTNPQNKLVVTSDATYNSENSYSIAAASATNPDFKTVIGYDYANDIGVIAAVRMGVAWKNLAILPTGGSNVGIGTTSPSYKLDVAGITRFQNRVRFANDIWNLSDDGYNRLYFGTNGRSYYGSGDGHEWRNASDSSIAFLTNGGNLILKGTYAFTTGGTATLSVVGDIISLGISNNDLSYFRRLDAGKFQWQTYNSGNNGEIHLQPYGGNVGIGTTSPREKLQIVGNTVIGSAGLNSYKTNLYLTYNAGSDETWVRIYVPQDYNSSNNGGTIRVRVLWEGDHATFGAYQDYQISYKTYFPASPYIKFSNVLCMNKTSDFNTGSTYYPPSSTPDVLFYDNSDGYLYVKVKGTNAYYNTARYIEAEIFGRTTAQPTIATTSAPGAPVELTKTIQFLPQEGNIYASGSIGIGTSSPSTKLEVNGGTGAASGNIARFTLGGAGGGTRGLTMYSDGSQLKLQVTDNVGNYGSWAFLNLNPDGGNVGIGTTSPATLLDVSGVITATGGNSTNWNTAYGWGNHSSAGYVPQARTLTINGTSYDLSANRTWTIPTSANIQEAANNGKVTTAASVGTTVITTVATASYDGATFNYVLKDGTNYRAGTIIAVWSSSAVQYNETTTNDIGSTVGVTFAVALNAGNAELRATSATSGWTVKVVTIGI